MSARSKARKRALDILYGADLRDLPIEQLLAEEAARADARPERGSSWPYARAIVEGVAEHRDELDQAIVENAHGWALDRMPVLDRTIARIGAWEILYNDEVPDAVAIAEGIESATVLSTDDSAGFLNGVLGAIARTKDADTST